MKVSDYLAQKLYELGARHVFSVTGGMAMHLNDSFHHGPLKAVYFHHEQAAAMAAEGYARVDGKPCVVCVTAGPGGINALNGVFGAYTDSIPMIIISGQCKRATLRRGSAKRQEGDQEVDIISMVRPVTKAAYIVMRPEDIRHYVEYAWHEATTGRPGPVWLDTPVDVQGSDVDPSKMKGFKPAKPKYDDIDVDAIIEKLIASDRPVLLVGSGVRISGAVDELREFCNKFKIPVVTAWTGTDLIETDSPYFCGRPGSVGDRAGNFTVQNSDLLIVVGSRLNVRQISYAPEKFAPNAYKIRVDIDLDEFHYEQMPILSDAKVFFRKLLAEDYKPKHDDWLARCRKYVADYPVPKPEGTAYAFVSELWEKLANDDMVVCSDGAACVVPMQVARINKDQRLWCNSGCASMGYGLPAAIGAAIARNGKRVICIEGDGSIQFNIQELQTAAALGLNIKIFVIDNDGYLSMRQTQQNFFGRLSGADESSGVHFCDLEGIAEAMGIFTFGKLSYINADNGPCLSLVKVDRDYGFNPKLASRQLPDGSFETPALDDMWPFLDREELARCRDVS